jgi:hypothetical protein
VAETEHYKVETEYTVEDKASGAAVRIEKAFKALGHEAHRLHEKFQDFRKEQRFTAAAMLGVGFGLGAWVEKAKEAVGGFERTKKSLAGLFAETLNWPSAVSGVDRYRAAVKLSTDVTEELEETVKDYGGTLDEAAAGFRGLTASVAPAHLKPKQLMELYKQVAMTAKATSTDVSMAAEQVGRAIMTGSVRPVGVLGKELYAAMHAHGKLTKQMGMQGRLNLVSQMMKGQRPIAEEMSKGIGDSLRKIQMSVEKIFRQVGAPLFAAVSKELSEWAKHLTHAEHSVKPIAEVIGTKLVAGFHVAKDVTGWLVDHWKELAVIWGSFKLAGMAGGAAGFLGRVGEEIGGNVGGAMGVFSKGLGAAAAKLGLFATAITGAYMAGQAFGEWMMSKVEKRIELQTHGSEMVNSAKILSAIAGKGVMTPQYAKFADKALKQLAESGTVLNGKIDRGAMLTNVSKMDDDDKRRLADYLGFSKNMPTSQMGAQVFADALTSKLEPLLSQFASVAPAAKKAEAATDVDAANLKTKGTQIGPFTGNITINQKFDDVDPDRVWVSTRRGIQENAERAVQSMHSDIWGE